MTQYVALFAAIGAILVYRSINGTPDGCASGRRHGENAPICAKVLHAPYDRHDNRCERENSAIAGPDERRDHGEARGVVLYPSGGEQELADGEDQCGAEQECYA